MTKKSKTKVMTGVNDKLQTTVLVYVTVVATICIDFLPLVYTDKAISPLLEIRKG